MEQKDHLAAVRNSQINFVSTSPAASRFSTLERRVVVTYPPELVDLARTGDPQVLHGLIELLKDPERAWAAEVVLAAMTGREEKIVEAFAASPDEWWNSAGRAAYERWNSWLKEVGPKLLWDPKEKIFLEMRR